MVCERCGTVFCWDEADNAPMDGRQRKRFCSEGCKKRASAQRKTKVERAWELMICERRGKRKYRDIVAARQAAGNSLLLRNVVTYPYPCVCGYWHLTRQVPKTTQEDWFYHPRVPSAQKVTRNV